VYALKDLLGDALVILLGPQRARQAAVLSAWPEVIGEARAKHARALGIRKQTLVVATDLPALFYELGMRRAELIGLLNQKARNSAISEIQIVMRPLDGPSDAPKDPRKQTGTG
jgi:predicted nucleic acid-binding Zn ribbon protein